jgi:DUF2075 family protein
MKDLDFIPIGEIASESKDAFVGHALLAMEARFTSFVVTPEQSRAWKIGFSWLHDVARAIFQVAGSWVALPEFVAPLVSGRPDLVIFSNRSVFVIEMKTGASGKSASGKKQVLEYSSDIWGKIRAARTREVIPVLLASGNKSKPIWASPSLEVGQRPTAVEKLNVQGLIRLLTCAASFENNEVLDAEDLRSSLLYSPRPSIVEAATALVASTADRNIVTGLSSEDELERLAGVIRDIGINASGSSERRVVVIAGPPGSGKTIVGLRIAHDQELQSILPNNSGTPLYLTGNAPLVDVLVESLARDNVRRSGITIMEARSRANAKVRLIHGVTEKKLGIESNVIVFDEGQRVWTAEHMRRKKGDTTLGSEAEEVLSYLESRDWALVIVLLGEGQEINTGEAGLSTWIEAVRSRNSLHTANWKLSIPPTANTSGTPLGAEVDERLRLVVVRRTDNSSDVSSWTSQLLDFNLEDALNTRKSFPKFPIFFTRDLAVAKSWLREQVRQAGGSSGLLASSRSKRLLTYGVDVVSDAGRSFNWENWYLNKLPDINSSEALEVAATEYKSQGLELDWVGICWSWDLVPSRKNWIPRTLLAARAKWSLTPKSKVAFQLNAYRVLLTRSRRGMVIWVPRGVPGDPTRDGSEMDLVAECLAKAGIEELNQVPSKI